MNWICPNCKELLSKEMKSYKCINNHSFDIAKQGYANLLLPNQKASRNPGDDAAMLQARASFFQGNHFKSLQEKLAVLLKDQFKTQSISEGLILDCGCGEGYYQRCLSLDLGPSYHFKGIDISKAGVRMAASEAKRQRMEQAEFAVASSANIPLADKSCIAVYSIFSPVKDLEIQRVLKDEACFIRVLPGPRHLYEIKEKIYREAKLHDPPKRIEGLKLLSETELSYDLCFTDDETYQNLIDMTPFAWEAKQASGGKELFKSGDTITADFNIQIFSRGVQ